MKNVFVFLFGLTLSFGVLAKTVVRFETPLGNIDVELRPDVAPITVKNFLKYIADNDYENSFFHRSVPGFVLQGGGFAIDNQALVSVRTDAPIQNEFMLSNLRGTIAMAKISGDPNSATSQWYFNLTDNNVDSATSSNLDAQNGGFTVFGSVVSGLEVLDAITELRMVSFNNLTGIPITSPAGSANLTSDLVFTKFTVLENDLKLNSGLNGYWFNPETSGQGIGIEILPTNNSAFMAWFTHDTQAADANTMNAIGDASNRWMSGLGQLNKEENSITFDLTVTSGGLFNTNTQVSNSEPNSIGSLKITFTDCSNAVLEFSLFGIELSGSINLIRIASDNVAMCNQLSLTQ